MRLVLLLFLSFGLYADNEVFVSQTGSNAVIKLEQLGGSNLIGGTNASAGSLTALGLIGSDMTLTINQIGASNLFRADDFNGDNVTAYWNFTGDSNVFDWNIGYIGDADNSDIDVTVTGSSNTWDYDQGYAASANYLDMDLTLVGSSNQFFIDIDSDQAKWEMDITGSSNNIDTKQIDASDHDLVVELDGDSMNMDIIQSSGSCGSNTCPGKIDLDLTSDNATVTINQKDSSD